MFSIKQTIGRRLLIFEFKGHEQIKSLTFRWEGAGKGQELIEIHMFKIRTSNIYKIPEKCFIMGHAIDMVFGLD